MDNYAHVLARYRDDELAATLEVGTRRRLGVSSSTILAYKEAQIHGEIRLKDHVEMVMGHPSLRRTHASILERLAECCGAPLVWIERPGQAPNAARRSPTKCQAARDGGGETPTLTPSSSFRGTPCPSDSPTPSSSFRSSASRSSASARSGISLAEKNEIQLACRLSMEEEMVGLALDASSIEDQKAALDKASAKKRTRMLANGLPQSHAQHLQKVGTPIVLTGLFPQAEEPCVTEIENHQTNRCGCIVHTTDCLPSQSFPLTEYFQEFAKRLHFH